MQFSRYLTYSKSDSTYRWLPWLIKIGLAVGALYYVVSKLLAEKTFLDELANRFSSQLFTMVVLLVVVLMVVNWCVEALKWQIIAYPMKPIPFKQALKTVITGVSLDAVLPLGTGAVAAKVLSLKSNSRNDLIIPVAMAQGLQSFWTVLFGAIGLWQLAEMTDLGQLYVLENRQFLLGGFAVVAFGGFYFIWPKAMKRWGYALTKYSLKSWALLVGISLLRYLVFLAQLMLLSNWLSPEIPFTILLGCATWMFFAKTIVPKPGHLGALGIRGASVVFFLGLAGYGYTGMVLATFALWVINLALPSLVGLFFIKELHFTSTAK